MNIKNKIRIERIKDYLFNNKDKRIPNLYPIYDVNLKISLSFKDLSDDRILEIYYKEPLINNFRQYFSNQNIQLVFNTIKYNELENNPLEDYELQIYKCYVMCYIIIYSCPMLYNIEYDDIKDKTIDELELLQDNINIENKNNKFDNSVKY